MSEPLTPLDRAARSRRLVYGAMTGIDSETSCVTTEKTTRPVRDRS